MKSILLGLCLLSTMSFGNTILWVELENSMRYSDFDYGCSSIYSPSDEVFLAAEITEDLKIAKAFLRTSQWGSYSYSDLEINADNYGDFKISRDDFGRIWIESYKFSARALQWFVAKKNKSFTCRPPESLGTVNVLPTFEFAFPDKEEITRTTSNTVLLSGKLYKSKKEYNIRLNFRQNLMDF